MLWLVDPTNVADAATADERTCVERISPVEGEGFELSVPLARESLFSREENGPERSIGVVSKGAVPSHGGPAVRIPLAPPHTAVRYRRGNSRPF
jgi:hypothetical protein